MEINGGRTADDRLIADRTVPADTVAGVLERVTVTSYLTPLRGQNSSPPPATEEKKKKGLFGEIAGIFKHDKKDDKPPNPPPPPADNSDMAHYVLQ